MKKTFFLFALLFCAVLFSQENKASTYYDINSRLDKLLAEREVDKRVLAINIENKTFVHIQNQGSIVYKKIINFLPNNGIEVIDFINDVSADAKTTKLYAGDYIKRNNIISVRADKLEGKKIGLPLTYNFMLQERDKILFLINLNNNERWIDTQLTK